MVSNSTARAATEALETKNTAPVTPWDPRRSLDHSQFGDELT